MKVLLLGGNGQVGWELRRSLAPLGDLVVLTREGEYGLCGDLTRPSSLAESVRRLAPDVIVNAAAYTDVERAESEPELAHAVNTTAPAALAAEARGFGSLLIHYSTDYVFDGTAKHPWREDDPTGPLNTYGRTKHDGELAIQETECRHLIFRTSWVYASRGKNFLRTMLRLAAEKETLQVIDDQYGAPTGAELIADVTAQVLPGVLCDARNRGIHHLAAAGETTWYGFASLVITEARVLGWPIRVADDAIAAVPTEAFQVKARRSHNSRLDCGKLEAAFGLRMPDWQDGVRRALREIVAHDGLEGGQ